jgi:hypothetical protein
MSKYFFKIVYNEEDNIFKYMRIDKINYNNGIVSSFTCSWFEKTFYDEMIFVMNKEINAASLLQELKDFYGTIVSYGEYKKAIRDNVYLIYKNIIKEK